MRVIATRPTFAHRTFSLGAHLPACLKLHRHVQDPKIGKLLADFGLDGLRRPLRYSMKRGISTLPIQCPKMYVVDVNNAIDLHKM